MPRKRRLFRIHRGAKSVERAVDDELQFHFDMTVRDLVAAGMSLDDARREAERRFGDVQRTRTGLEAIDRAHVGQAARAAWISALVQDTHYALRGLRMTPVFTAGVVLTLGLGVGANATMFGIVDRLLFRPPEYLIAPDRATRLYLATTDRGTEEVSSGFGYRRYTDIRAATHSFDAMTPFTFSDMAVGEGEATAQMKVASAGAEIWSMFDVKPVIGRFFTAAEDQPADGTPVVVLSYAFWQTHFGGRPDALGRKIEIESTRYTVIGVAPERFNGFAMTPIAAFIPFAAGAATGLLVGPHAVPWYQSYGMVWFDVFARMKPGVSTVAANADLTLAFRRSYASELQEQPRTAPIDLAKPRAFAGPVLSDRGPDASKESRVATWLGGVALVVLLIACANVANLLLARALKRRREIAVRVALGISRRRLLAQLFVESALLSLGGGVVGVALAQWGGGVMRRMLLRDAIQPGALTEHRVLIFSAIIIVVVGVVTGVAPALLAGRTDVVSSLKAGWREGAIHRSRLSMGLLMVQAAFSAMLLIGAGVFLRSLSNVEHLRLGYDADRLLWVELNFRGVKLDSARDAELRESLVATAQHLPGVDHAARASTVPFWSMSAGRLFIEGIDTVRKLGMFQKQIGGADYFATMGTRVLRGRALTGADGPNAPPVMVVTKAMANRLWPGQDALGKCIRVGSPDNPCAVIVGIAEDVRLESLSEPQYEYYMPISQQYSALGGIFVRVRGNAAGEADQVRRALQALMPGASYITVTPMSTIVAPEFASFRLGATMFTVFGVLALVVAAIGLYSSIAYNVTQRTHEMGLRVALGAESWDVVRLVVRQGLQVVIPGIALGTGAALIAGRWIAPLLFNVSPSDPPVIVTVVGVLLLAAVGASWLPARRASRVDANEALRAD